MSHCATSRWRVEPEAGPPLSRTRRPKHLPMKFLKDNWVWIVAPVVTVLIVVLALLWFTDGGPADDFTYPLN